jgi:hypothetical protein
VNSKVFRFTLIYRHAPHRIDTEANGFEELQCLSIWRQRGGILWGECQSD